MSCDITFNSTDVIVNCNLSGIPPVPENVTILICVANMDFCTSDLFCNPKFDKLRVLDISLNDLEIIPKGCFSSFTFLEKLTLSDNGYMGFDNLYNACYGLNQTRIQELNAIRINHHVIVNRPFPRNISRLLTNTSLHTLNLGNNGIKFVEVGVLYYLPRTLQKMSVSGNRLRFIDSEAIIIEINYLENLKELDISNQRFNTVTFRPRERKHVPLRDESVTYENNSCDRKVFIKFPTSLEILRAWKFYHSSSCLAPVHTSNHSHLKYLDLSYSGFLEWIGPLGFNSLEELNLSENQCTFIKTDFFNYMTHLMTLNINKNYLGPYLASNSSIRVFQDLRSLMHLQMRENFINHLPKNLIRYNVLLKELDISHNEIETLDLDIRPLKQLTYIDCSSNKLTTLPKSFRDSLDRIAENTNENLQNITIDLSKNRILCTCENLDFLEWFMMSQVVVRVSPNETCTGYDGNLTQAYQYLRNECKKDNGVKEWLYPLQTMCILFILFVSLLIVYKKRWSIIYRWYMFRLQRKGYTPIEGCNDGYQYDAFLSFADEDRPFVDQVVTKLEENTILQCQVCVHYRDFTPGKSIYKNIVEAIHMSKKTVVFISRAFLKSSWCRYELRMAMTEESYRKRQVVVMVVLEAIPNNDLPLDILQYYNKKSYIEKPTSQNDMEVYWKMLGKMVANDDDL